MNTILNWGGESVDFVLTIMQYTCVAQMWQMYTWYKVNKLFIIVTNT